MGINGMKTLEEALEAEREIEAQRAIVRMQHFILTAIWNRGGRDMQIIDGRMCEIIVRPVTEGTAEEAVKRVLEGQGNASTSD